MRIFQNSDSFSRICGRVIDSLLSVHLRHYSSMTLAYGLSSTENKISKALFFFLNSSFFFLRMSATALTEPGELLL